VAAWFAATVAEEWNTCAGKLVADDDMQDMAFHACILVHIL